MQLSWVFLSRYLASGSGDTTVRFWDVNTETPQFTCKGKETGVSVCLRDTIFTLNPCHAEPGYTLHLQTV